MLNLNTILPGDALEVLRTLPNDSVDCCVTSPPYYGLRDYGVQGQIGMEEAPELYIERLVAVFMEVHRMLKADGTLWINIDDSYLRKNLAGIPWRLGLALQGEGWYLRDPIIWHKPNVMPESVTDRCVSAYEYILMLSKSASYYYDYEAILEPSVGYDGRKDTVYKGGVKDVSRAAHERWPKRRGYASKEEATGLFPSHHGGSIPTIPMRRKRNVWTVATRPYHEAHSATFPPDLIVPCIKAGCPPGSVVLDPFMGAGTTAVVARKLNRNYVGIELNTKYIALAQRRIQNELGMFA
jgi:site-specific DNA-methyltransferase (adenine-specific)